MKIKIKHREGRHTLVVLVLGRLRQEDLGEFEASLGYVMRA